MKQTLWIAAAGALLFAGCKSNDVMDQRNYSGPKPEEVTQLPPPKTEAQQVVQPKAMLYEPMTDAVSTGGVDSVSAALPGKSSTYIVRKGDTLGKIAAMHGVKLGALMAVNNMDAKKAKQLKIGQKLTIPSGGVAVKSGKVKKAAAGKAAAVATGKLDKDGFYVIQSGDSIARIAARFQVKSSEIFKANNMTEADARRLQIGQKLVIPGKSPAAAVPEVKAPAVSEEAAPVDSGTFAESASSEGSVTPAAAVEAAPVVDLSKTTIIEVTEESISLADFAKKHNTDAETLRQLNQGCAQMLQKGDPIIIPTKE
ncbi:MAG: LysM peptidoglycan-binding domain-containing protein [Victivallaceae bacterium]|nr:LysM peptidoglycan-binding domain-containing protein [Victivallaceae bacterium]